MASGFSDHTSWPEVHGASALRRDPYRVPQAHSFWEAKYPLAYRSLVGALPLRREKPAALPVRHHAEGVSLQPAGHLDGGCDWAPADDPADQPPRRKVRRAPYTDDILYDPEGTFQFGAWYIGHLLQKFKAQVPLGRAASMLGRRR